MKNSVLIIANSGAGLFFFRKQLIAELMKNNYHVIACLPENDPYKQEVEKLGCIVIDACINRRGVNAAEEIKLFKQYYSFVKTIKPSVVLLYTIKPNIYGGIACSILGVPYISTITGLGTEIENGGIKSKALLSLYRVGLRKAKKIFVQNTNIEKILSDNRIGNKQRELVPGSGVDISEFSYEPYPPQSGSIRFLYIGRIMKDKGINELLTAAKTIRSKHSNVVFELIGRYEDKEYEEKINALVNTNIINYYGFQDNVKPYIYSSHALINPSYHEGMSNVLLEAASCGRPVIATNVPGCKETFNDGISGIGFEPRKAEALINAIEEFIALSHDKKEQMGIAGRRLVESSFDRSLVVKKYISVINNIEGEK